MVGCVVATAAAAAAIVFGASLAELVDEPETYGWPWDVAVITGAGYGDTAIDVVDERLAQPDVRDDIVDHGFYSFDPAVVFGDRPAPVVFGWSGRTAGDLPVREGRAPTRTGEALVGEDTAEGSASPSATRSPSSPPSSAPSTSRWSASASSRPSARSWPTATGLGTGVYTLVDGEPSELQLARAHRHPCCATAPTPRRSSTGSGTTCRSWSLLYETPVTHSDPVRSPEIVNVSELRVAPLVLGGVLLASLALGLWLAVTLSVRDRRRELAVLRALGFAGRDVRGSVRWQGMTLVAVGIVLGIPLGIIGGRAAWRFFADQLGVIPRTSVPLSWLALEVLLTAVLGWFAVAIPAARGGAGQPHRRALGSLTAPHYRQAPRAGRRRSPPAAAPRLVRRHAGGGWRCRGGPPGCR